MGRYDDAERESLGNKKSRAEVYKEQLKAKFLALPLECKNLIREAAREGIEWRGEDCQRKIEALGGRSHFEIVIDEYREMRRVGASQYRCNTMAKVNALKGRMLGKVVGGGA